MLRLRDQLSNQRIDEDTAAANEQGSYEGFTRAQSIVMFEYRISKRDYVTSEILLNEIIWEQNFKDLLDYLKAANIKSFMLTNKSTELMELLYFFSKNGCSIDEAVKIEKKEEGWKGLEFVKGIRIIIK